MGDYILCTIRHKISMRDQGGMNEHRSPDSPDEDPRGSSAEERSVPKEEDIQADQNPEGATIDKGRGGVCNTQRGCGQGAAANEGTGALDLPGDLVSSRQTDGATDNRECQRYGGKKSGMRVPTSTAGG